MIAYDLICHCGLQFEGWFKGREEFLAQQEKKLLACPVCGGHGIKKILSPVRYQGRNDSASRPLSAEKRGPETRDVDQGEVLKTIQAYVEKNFEDVGTDLAKEALKIHYGVERPRNLRGVASSEEECQMKKEGIRLLKIPLPGKKEDPVQ